MTLDYDPRCYPTSGFLHGFGRALYYITAAPFALFFLNTLILVHRSGYTIKSVFLIILFKTVLIFSSGIQIGIGSVRPIPQCVPWYFTRNAIPDPNIVYIWGMMILIVYYFVYVKKWRRGRSRLGHIPMCIEPVIQMYMANLKWLRIIRIVVEVLLYHVIYYSVGLATGWQILVTVVWTTGILIPMIYAVHNM